MLARVRKFLSDLAETFWVVPAAIVVLGIVGAVGLVQIDRSGLVPTWLLRSAWLYNGGGTGARTLLGAIAGSTIGVAGTVFSITIAALSLAAGQMGPRLLRNFTRDRGNQVTLGAFLGTFSYALMVLRSVRTQDEGSFIPYLSLNVGIALAFVCVGTLVYFVGHMAGRINVETVIGIVSEEVLAAMRRLTTDAPQPAPPGAEVWHDARPVPDPRHGYLQQLDENGLANWAAERRIAIRLLVRPGDYVFPGAPIALAIPTTQGVAEAVRDATALGPQRLSSADLEFAVRQLVEVAVRALSPGINDPHTAIGVLDRLGAALCGIVDLHLPSGVILRDNRAVLVVPSFEYSGLADAMFHMIRQNGSGSTAVLIRILEVLTSVLKCERNPARIAVLQRHADLVMQVAEREILTPADLADVRGRHAAFITLRTAGLAAYLDGKQAAKEA